MLNLKRDFNLKKVTLTNFINTTDKEKELIRRLRNKGEIRKWMYSDHIISKKEHSRFIKNLFTNNKNFYWLVKNNNGGYIGVVSLNRMDFRNKNSYLGIYADPDNNLLGKGKLLMGAIKELIFNKLNFHTLKLEVIAYNERAFDFYKKYGFKREGKLKEFVFKNGRCRDVVVMGITRKNKIWNSR